MKPIYFKVRRFLLLLLTAFLLMNSIAFFHAYRFTHFASSSIDRTKNPEELSFSGKLKALVFGIDQPRPVANNFPTVPYQTIEINSIVPTNCWYIEVDGAKGTVVLYHGFSGEKSSMLDKAELFMQMGYNALLVDFMGSGSSGGNKTTVGYKEAQQVRDSYNYLKENGEENIVLFGTSMGAVAILKAFKDYQINPSAIILECPFGSMLQTTKARFRTMGVPSFPMAHLLVFWGGAQHGFWAFGHNPEEYAMQVTSPTLLLHGKLDEKVSMDEINSIFNNLKGEKTLRIYPTAAHENYLNKYSHEWEQDVEAFLFVNVEKIRGYNSINIKNGYKHLEIRSPREFGKYED